MTPRPGPLDLPAARRRLWQESAGIAVSATGFGFVYGLAARGAGFSPLEAMAMSVLVFAGAAQFAAVGYVAGGLAWPGVILLTALLNARHLLYSAALAPWLRDRPVAKRAVMAHVLTDEAFALSIAHFRRLGRADDRGYWIAASRRDVHPVEPGHAGGRRPRRPDRGPVALRPRRRLPGSDGRPVRRAHQRPARARRRGGRGDGRGPREPGRRDRRRDHRRRRPRPAGRPARPDGRRPTRRPRSGPPPRPSVTRRPARRTRRSIGTTRSGPAMSSELVLLAVLMAAVTYPSRAVPLLAPGIERLPRWALDYLQLVGPAVLAALAAVNVMVVTEDGGPAFHVGVEWLAVIACDRPHGLASEPVPRPGVRGGPRRARASPRLGRLSNAAVPDCVNA